MLVIITVILLVSSVISTLFGWGLLGYIGVHREKAKEYYRAVVEVFAIAAASIVGLLTVIMLDSMGAF